MSKIVDRTYTPGQTTARNELALIERILAGERELFMELVGPYQKLVYYMAVTIVKCEYEAEDVSQEALFKAFENLSQFRRECKLPSGISTAMFFRLCTFAPSTRMAGVPGRLRCCGICMRSSSLRYLPVREVGMVLSSEYVAAAITRPPFSPAPGPRSKIRSEERITS